MRISLIGPVYPYRGGISHYTASLARACTAEGHILQLISFSRQYPAWLYPGKTDKDPSSFPIQTEAEFILDPIYPWTWLKTARRILDFQPDVVVIQWWTTFWGPAMAALASLLSRKGVRAAFLVHNVLPHELRPWDIPLARMALRRGGAFIVQTQREQERLRKMLPTAKTYICPHPVYEILSKPGLLRHEARQRLELDPERFWLLFFGLVRPYKGLGVTLQALAQLRSIGIRPGLAVVGEFWHDKAAYLADIEQMQLGDQVRIEDRYIPDEEIALWFSAADCLAAPYLAGTQSGVAAIAQAYGLPMIASQKVAEGIAPENRDLVLAAVPPGDAAALAAAIQAAIEKPVAVYAPRRALDSGWQKLVKTLEQIALPETS